MGFVFRVLETNVPLHTHLKRFSLSFKYTSSHSLSVKMEGIWLTVSHKPSQNERLLLD